MQDVASNRSIPYGIAKAVVRVGAEVAFTFKDKKLKDRVEKLSADLGVDEVLSCDVASDQDIEALFYALNKQWDSLSLLLTRLPLPRVKQLKGIISTLQDEITSESLTT